MQVRDAVVLSIGIVTAGVAALMAMQGGWDASAKPLPTETPSVLPSVSDWLNTTKPQAPEAAEHSGVHVRVAAEHSILLDSDSETLAMIEVEANSEVVKSEPVSLVVVLDVSGSMNGNKLNNAKLATNHLATMMGADDRMSIVSFGSSSSVWMRDWSPSQGLALLNSTVDKISLNGGTCISCGLERAFQLFEGTPNNRLRRVVLLSDGEANEGLITQSRLLAMAKDGLNRLGAVTSTIALGGGVDAPLLSAMSNGGEGDFYFARNSAVLTEVLKHETRKFTQAVARDMVLTLEPLAGASINRYATIAQTVVSNDNTIHVGRLNHGQKRRFLVPLHVLPGHEGQLLHVRAKFVDSAAALQHIAVTPLRIERSNAKNAVAASRNMTVASEAAWVRANKDIGQALQQQRSGNTVEAKKILNGSLQTLIALSEHGGDTTMLERPIREVRDTFTNLPTFAPGSLALKAAQLTNDACLNDNAVGMVQEDTYHFNGMHRNHELE